MCRVIFAIGVIVAIAATSVAQEELKSSINEDDVLNRIWSHWAERESKCASIDIEYTTHAKLSSFDRRDTKRVTVSFDPKGRMYCKTITATKGEGEGTYSTEELILDEFGINYFAINDTNKIASLFTRSTSLLRVSELTTTSQLFRPALSSSKDNYRLQPDVVVDGKPCNVVERTYDAAGDKVTITLFLLEELDFLPIRRVVEFHNNGRVSIRSELTVSYEKIQNTHFAKAWTLRETAEPGGPNSSTRSTTAVRTNIKIGDALPAERFSMKLDLGTKVEDHRKEPKFVETLQQPRIYE